MAEIKSTMDMVMERAARIAARAVGQPDSQESERIGMRLAAEYISRALDDLGQALAGQSATERFQMKHLEPLKREWLTRIKGMMSDTTFNARPSQHNCKYCKFNSKRGGPCKSGV